MTSEVTVLLPVYNGAAYLRAAIDSILAQTWRDFELLVIDDGSTDDSAEIASAVTDPRVRVVRNERNLGLAATLNRGLELARGGLVARQDADDVSEPLRLERQVAFVRRHPDVALVGTQAWQIDPRGRRVGLVHKPCETTGILWTMLFDNAFVHTSVLFRRDLVLSLKGYDPRFVHCQDYELWSRLLRAHRAANLAEPLVLSRQHPASMTETVQTAWAYQSLEVMSRNQAHTLGEALPREAAELLARIRAGTPPDLKATTLTRLEDVKRIFLRRVASARQSADFHIAYARHRAAVLAAHGFRPGGLVVRHGWPPRVARSLVSRALRALWARFRPDP